MNSYKYFLTYDFKVLYCPNIKLKLSTNELNPEKLTFEKYEGNLDIIEYMYEIKADLVGKLTQTIFNGEIGFELEKEQMDWIIKFENLLKEDESILNDKKLTFNYLVLKLILLGFSEKIAINFIKTYYINSEIINEFPTPKEITIKINKLLKIKKFWIPNDINRYKDIEAKFIRTLFNYKKKLQYTFNFSSLKDEYYKVVEKSFIKHLYEYNKKTSYLINNPLSITEQEVYLKESYNRIICGIFEYLINNEFIEFTKEERFINNSLKEMLNIVDIYIKILKTKKA